MQENVKHRILVLSDREGLGKLTASTQFALTRKKKGFQNGLLDVDLCGPSISYLLQFEGKDVHQADGGWIPVYIDGA